MKHFIITLCSLLLFAQTLTAQVTWFNPADQWTFHITSGWVGEGIEQIWVEKDTAIGGLAYKKLGRLADFSAGVSAEGFRVMRQDGKRIFALPEIVFGPSSEFLMYDFTLKAGDTVKLSYFHFGSTTIRYVITDVSTVVWNGQARIKQNIKWVDLPNYSGVKIGALIEGIGCVEGLNTYNGADYLSNSYLFLDEPSNVAVDGFERTFCNFQSDAFTFEGSGNIKCRTLPVQNPMEAQVTVYPSLSAGTLYFSVPDPSVAYRVTLYDLAGRQIAQTVLSGDGTITTDYKGSAMVVLQTSTGRAVKRVVFF